MATLFRSFSHSVCLLLNFQILNPGQSANGRNGFGMLE